MKALGAFEADGEQLPRGVEPVVGLGAVEVALHGVDEEADDEFAVAGFLSDDVGEFRVGALASIVVSVACGHAFYSKWMKCGLSRGDCQD